MAVTFPSLLLGKSWYDFDCHIFASFQVLGKLDLAVHAPTQLVNYLIVVDELPPGSEVGIDVGLVRPIRRKIGK